MMPDVTMKAIIDPGALDETFRDFSCKKDAACNEAADRTEDRRSSSLTKHRVLACRGVPGNGGGVWNGCESSTVDSPDSYVFSVRCEDFIGRIGHKCCTCSH